MLFRSKRLLKAGLLVTLAAAPFIAPALAQIVTIPQVLQTGSVTAGDFATWNANGVIQDAAGTGNLVTTGNITAATLIPSGSTVPTDGIYLPAANTTGIADRSLGVAKFTTAASGVNQFLLTGTATGGLSTIALGGSGADATAPVLLGGNSTGKVYLGGTTAANAGVQVAPVASSVNQVIVTPTATAGLTTIAAGGSGADATAPLLVGGNSTGLVYLGGTTAANAAVQAATVASSVNQIVLTSAATGNVPSIALGGSGADANRNLKIAPAGSGVTLFGTAGTANGSISLSGSSSGSTNIIPAAAASGVLTLPAITGAVMAVGTPVACGASCTLAAANLNTYTRMDQASGSTVTLPGATGSGATYKIYISVATSSNQDKVLTNPTTDTIIGTGIGENAGTAKVFVGNALTAHSIQMPFAGTQPSGGFIGDSIVCTDVASTIWKCDVNYQAGTTPTTPYSTSTS